MKYVFFLLTITLLFASCEKEVNIKLNGVEKKMVVEGIIEVNEVPYVSLTRSIGFFDKIDLSSVQYISNALVTVTDLNTSKSILLKEYVIDTTIAAWKAVSQRTICGHVCG